MTTIAYKNGVVACDKQCTDNGRICKGSYKAVLTADKVYVVTGKITMGLKFVEWLEQGGRDLEDVPAPKLKGTEILEMDLKTGKATVWEDDFPLPVEDKIMALGSGGDIALGAMAAGASPEESIKIAEKWDDGTGLGVQIFRSHYAKRIAFKTNG